MNFIKKRNRILAYKLLSILASTILIFSACKTEVDQSDTTPPGEVKNISITAGDKCLSLSWTNPSDGDFASTQITFTPEEDGIVQPIVIKGEANKTSATKIEELKNDTEYTIIFITIDNNGNESNGIERAATPIDNAPPGEVSDLVITPHHEKITLNWTNPADSDFYGVEITFLPSEETIIQPIFIEGNPSEKETYTIENLQGEKDYELTIKTIDKKNNKSEGIKKSSNTKESTLSLTVTLPNDDGDNITLTNDNAPVIVNISSTDSIIEAVWKKNENAESPNANNLLDDETANELSLDSLSADSNKLTFTVTENGFYDIAVKNAEGIAVCIQTEIKTIDKTPLAEVETVETSSDGEYVHISWKDSENIDKYDSPLKNIKISYVYNDDESDPDNGELTIDAGVEKAAIKIADGKSEYDFMRLSIQSLDELGNISDGNVFHNYTYIQCTAIDLKEKIENLTQDGIIAITGECDLLSVKNALISLKTKNPTIKVLLDLSKTTGISTTKSAFINCSVLKSIILPSSIRRIETDAFKNCQNLTSITIPDTVTTIYGCRNSSIRNIYFNGTLEQWCNINWVDRYPLSAAYNLYINDQRQTDIIIPDTVTYLKTTVFYGCTSLINISISKSVTSIDDYAFYSCTNLTNIELSSNLTSIGYAAFDHCTNLTQIHIPESVKEIDAFAFANCINLTSISIPDSVTRLNGTFINCSKLTSVTIGNKVTYIGSSTFEDCINLTNITIPDNVTRIAGVAFSNCSSLKNINLGNGITYIGKEAFKDCINLTNITIPDSVTEIGEEILLGCKNLKEITFPYVRGYFKDFFMGKIPVSLKKVTVTSGSISYQAFYGCSNIEQIILCKGVTNIGESAFENCSSIEEIEIPSSVNNIEKKSFANCSKLKSIIINHGVTNIGDSAFENCLSIEDIEIPGSVNSIGKKSVANCSKLTNLILNNGIISIGDSAFTKCSNIEEIKIPNSVTSIGKTAFADCSKLKKIIINNGVTSIGNTILSGCSSLEEITIPFVGANAEATVASETTRFDYLFQMKDIPSSLKKVTVSGGNILSKSFYDCSNIEHIILCQGVTSIGDSAFERCSKLESIIIPNSVTNIGETAFAKCSKLTNIIINDGILSIGNEAFQDCTNLASIVIPNSVTNIGNAIFSGCSSLEDVTIPFVGANKEETKASETTLFGYFFEEDYSGIEQKWKYDEGKKYAIPSSLKNVTVLGGRLFYGTFYNCQNLVYINIGNEVTSIDDYVFYNCTNLEKIIIGDSVTDIGSYAFNGCTNITNLLIPDSVTHIAGAAFSDCTQLTSINIPSSIKSIGSGIFKNCSTLTVTIATSNGLSAFNGCSDLRIIITDEVTIIPSSAFRNNKGLTSITIPESITRISKEAFYGCTNLKNMTFLDTKSIWYITRYYNYKDGESIGQMSSTNLMANANKFIKDCNNFFYNEKYNK